MLKQLRSALAVLGLLTVLTGVVYPLVVTGVALSAFPRRADGSLIEQNGKIVGSRLIGQPFNQPRYFWGRLSATPGHPYNAGASSGSNEGPRSAALAASAKARLAALGGTTPVPVDLVTASGSGLDPDISPAAAAYQIPRVARARRLPVARVRELVARHTAPPALGVFGEPRVDVLELNLALDRAQRGIPGRR